MIHTSKMESILIVAPFSPPVTGQSVATEFTEEILTEHFAVSRLNTSKSSLTAGVGSLRRVLDSFYLVVRLRSSLRKFDHIYYTISQSTAGAIKDLVIFLICFDRLDRFVLHSHGFGIKRVVLSHGSVFRSLYRAMLSRVRRLILLGESHSRLLADDVDLAKVSIIPNFAASETFLGLAEVEKKYFSSDSKVNILFLSNLIPGKGHNELLLAFKILSREVSGQISLTFAGAFASKEDKLAFLEQISTVPDVSYFGVASFHEKVRLLQESHIFCLPTYYTFEGQPISILEALASGCNIVTTAHAGIPDVCDSSNGGIVEERSPSGLADVIKSLILDRKKMAEVGLQNNLYAHSRFTEDNYRSLILKLFS